MNIYIIYKFSEFEILYPYIKNLEDSNPKDKIFYFTPNNSGKNDKWKDIAEKKIKESNIVLYLRLNTNHYDENAYVNINYELSLAQKIDKKIIVIEIPSNDNSDETHLELPKIIYEKDFLDNQNIKYKVCNSLDMKMIKTLIFDINEELFKNSNTDEPTNQKLLLEEYKIMLDTSEKMMDRRQGTNNFYITLCTAMLTVIVAFIATKINTLAWCFVTFFISLMMLFVCNNWKKTLEAYGLSNQAKYEVLNKIEEKLPASIFTSEWKYGKIIDYTSYSKREAEIPKLFFWIFCGIMFVVAILFIGTLNGKFSINMF